MQRTPQSMQGTGAECHPSLAATDAPLIRASRTFSRREKDLDETLSRDTSAEIPLPPGEGGRRPGGAPESAREQKGESPFWSNVH